MNSEYVTACKRSHREVLRCWTDLLQVEPGWQYVESTSYFTDLMESILSQLWSVALVPRGGPWPNRPTPMALPQWDPSRCGLDITLPFLKSGRAALREVLEKVDLQLTGLTDGQRARLQWEMLLAFDSMAQRGIEQVCANCRLGGDCVFSGRPAALGWLQGPGAAGRGKLKHAGGPDARLTTLSAR
jgi:hypothetical protein